MKIFFIVSQDGTKDEVDSDKIAATLEAQGNKVTISKINEKVAGTKDDPVKAYQKNINNVKKADFVIVECSKSNAGLGLLISAAVNEKKPVLALFDQTKVNSAPATIAGFAAKNKLLAVRGYSKTNLETVFSEFVNEVKKVLDTKFILIISPEIDTYLQWASDNRRMHKAQVVRRAVEQVMNDDKEFKKYANAMKRK